MSIPANGVNSCNYGCVHYRPSGYPTATCSIEPANQQRDNYSPPPAYETIDRLATWNEENFLSNTPLTTEIWIRRTENNVPSRSHELHMAPSFQRASSPLYYSPPSSPGLSRTSAVSHQNSYTAEPQTADFKQRFRNFRPRVLGIALIFVSISELSLGTLVAMSLHNHDLKSLSFGTVFWVPGFQMFAGTMLILSWVKTSICSETEFNIYCCLIALNILSLLLSFFASCIGNVTLGLKTGSPHPYAITSMP
ncbi:uncharacterized protein ACNLHF_021684 isoform 2-T2 [Anomaloglossus baeobatrachus]|uniref:uncharacterized protein LOC142309914 isoform X2 n=1 Tax=Anomaloglossus baeobatrachus TaxID=238106 RepID=UPI003F5002F8